MKAVTLISALGILAMGGIITYAFIAGDFSADGAILLALPWGQVSMVDLYTGFILFSVWIVYREKSVPRSILWVALMMTLGSFTAALYMFLAARQSGGDWKRFWLGRRLAD